MSTEQIDPEFTSVMPAVTPTPVNAVLTDQSAFANFSYAEGIVHWVCLRQQTNDSC